MTKFLLFYIFIMLLLTFLYHYNGVRRNKMMDFRTSQAEGLNKNNMILARLEKIITNRVKPSTKRKTELLLAQSGFNLNYIEFLSISILAAFLMAMIFGFTMNNIILAVVFGTFGLFVPYQVASYLKNKRLLILETQIGSFLKMSISRYENTKDFNKALRLVEKEFRGEEPIHNEIEKTIREIDTNTPLNDAISNLAERTGNKYMKRFAAYFEVTAEVGTEAVRRDLLRQAYKQYEEDYQLKRELKKEISGPVQEAYIMIGAVPAFALYQVFTNDGYIKLMTTTSIGKIGTAAIIGILVLIIWFINTKMGAPLE